MNIYSLMEIENYIDKMKDFQETLLEFIDNDIDDITEFSNIIDFIASQKSRDEIRSILELIANISKHHQRLPTFFTKIKQVLLQIKDEIQNFFLNYEIFRIFQGNKRLLLLLIEEEIMKPDKLIAEAIQKDKYLARDYHSYFYPEMNSFYDRKFKKKVLSETIELQENDIDKFNEKRRIGENDYYLYELIRNDSIDEFIQYVNRCNISIKNKIRWSLFETNTYLLKNDTTMIEYSAFYGSIQIFKFLYMSQAVLSPSLWMYAIHGRNPDIIHFLEGNGVVPTDTTYEKCLTESLKCYHKELTDYIELNLLKKSQNNDFDISIQGLRYKNYTYFPNDLVNESGYYYFCKYNYVYLYKILLKTTYMKINTKIILKKKI